MELMLEVTPPQRKASTSTIERSAARVVEAVKRIGNVGYVNIPEIAEENYTGAPLYRHCDIREFSATLRKSISAEMVINKITVHMKSKAELSSWIDESVSKYGLKRFVFVGGMVDSRKYPGPSVREANQLASKVDGVKAGNICIPSRDDEVARMVSKTESGASFFTTQALLDSGPIIKVIRGYEKECSKMAIAPASVFLSFAAASSAFDVDFLRWLGVEIPEKREAQLKKGGDVAEVLNEAYKSVLSDVTAFVSKEGINVPIGLNVESISSTNLEDACRVAEQLCPELKTP